MKLGNSSTNVQVSARIGPILESADEHVGPSWNLMTPTQVGMIRSVHSVASNGNPHILKLLTVKYLVVQKYLIEITELFSLRTTT